MIQKKLNEIEEPDLQSLVTNKVTEHKTLE